MLDFFDESGSDFLEEVDLAMNVGLVGQLADHLDSFN